MAHNNPAPDSVVLTFKYNWCATKSRRCLFEQNNLDGLKVRSHTAQHPVLRIDQGALHLIII